MKNKKYLFILFLIILVGLFFRIYPFEAQPWIANSNNELINQTLNLGRGFLEKNTSFLQERIEYPYLTSYLLLFGYGIFYLVGTFSGLFSSATEFIGYLFFHLSEFYWHSRILIAIFGTLCIPLVYLTIRQIFHQTKEKKIILGSFLAAWLMAFSLLSVQFSQQVRPHIVVSFFILLSFYFYLVCLKKKSLSSYIILAVSCGLAMGAFVSGVFAFVFLILANYFLTWPGSRIKWSNLLKSFLTKRFLTGLVVFLIVISVFYFYLFFDSSASRFSLENQEEGLSLSLGNFPFLISDPGLGFITILKGLFFHEPTMGLLLIIFLVFYFLGQKKKKEKNPYYTQVLIGWWAFVASYTIIFGLLDSGVRYQLLSPLIPFVCLGLAILFVSIFDNLGKYKKLIFSLVILLLLFQSVQSFRLVQLISRPYTGEIASQWIEKNISSSQLIILEGVLVDLIPNKESIEIQAQMAGLSRRNIFLLSLEPDEYPLNSKSILNFSQLAEYQGNDIPSISNFFKEIKPSYFVLAFRPTEYEKEGYLAYQIARDQGQLIENFSPFKNSQPSRSLKFPSGMDNPIIDLWISKQLGPDIDIYKLDWSNYEK